jgi:hypothetical protein
MRFNLLVLRIALFVWGILVLQSCANQLPPDGGPIDTTPPTIISTYPPAYTVLFKGNRISLEFDKYVDHRSVEESIFISPFVGELEFSWSGKEIEISFSEALRRNKTYVINIGTDVKEIRNQNRMAQAFTLAFSTGEDIDHGAIRGRVFPLKTADPSEGVMIFAYQLAGLDPDTLNPRSIKPDYVTQTGKGGEFFLNHLEFGSYRVIAVRDEYRNLLYDPEVDEFGVPAHDIMLTPGDSLQADVFMQLAKEDTTAPRLVKIDPRDRNHLLTEFSEPIDTSSVAPIKLSVLDTLRGSVLRTYSVFPNLPKTSLFTVVTEPQDSSTGYILRVVGARDRVGIPMNPKADALTFSGAAKSDSSATRILATSIPDSGKGVVLLPALEIAFSDALQRNTLAHAVTLKDSTGKKIPVTLNWLSDAAIVVQLQNRLLSKCWYTLSVLAYDALDWSGRKLRDSLKIVRFETLDADALSSIEGAVVDTNRADANGDIYVVAEALDVKDQKSFTARATNGGAFALPEIQEGRYVVKAFRDRNSNGVYDVGQPFPYTKSERFNFAHDTLKVRARWPLEGVRIELK